MWRYKSYVWQIIWECKENMNIFNWNNCQLISLLNVTHWCLFHREQLIYIDTPNTNTHFNSRSQNYNLLKIILETHLHFIHLWKFIGVKSFFQCFKLYFWNLLSLFLLVNSPAICVLMSNHQLAWPCFIWLINNSTTLNHFSLATLLCKNLPVR